MAILTRADLANAMAGGQQLQFVKLTNMTTPGAAGQWGGCFSNAGSPVGTLAGTNTANGTVPDDTVAGFPSIRGFAGGVTGYLGQVTLANWPSSTAMSGQRLRLTDCLFKAGAYSFNAAVTLSAQPSYSARIPGADYKGTEIWFEQVTAFTGIPTITVTYTNQDGVAGQSTTLTVAGTLAVARMSQIPLAAGDTGVQKIESVTATVATAGTFNILVLRPLFMAVAMAMGDYDYINYGPDKTGLPTVFATSALYWMSWNSAGAAFGPEAIITIING